MSDETSSAGVDAPKGLKKHGLLAFILTLVITLLLSSAWLVFPYMVEGQKLMKDAGTEIRTGRNTAHRTLSTVLARGVETPDQSSLAAVFSTEEYFKRTATARIAAQYDTKDHYVFTTTESVHTGTLPDGLPVAIMTVDGVDYPIARAEGAEDADHHRNATFWFPRFDANGNDIIQPDSELLELTLSHNWDERQGSYTMSWQLPIEYPEEGQGLSSPMIVFALSAGILSSVLTPCLIQLVVVFMATITGMSAEQLRKGDTLPKDVRRRVMMIAIAFIVGVTVFYTAAGAAIGFAGKSAQFLFESYSKQLAVGSGILVIAMGIWMGIQTRAPLVCRLPMKPSNEVSGKGAYVRSALMAVGFSLGCMVCFSGSILTLLFVYVGYLGSAWLGGLILFIFSMGVAIPFLAAAFFLSRTMSVMNWVSKYTPQIGLISMLIIIGFGLILVFDQFHTVSDLIYPLLGLS